MQIMVEVSIGVHLCNISVLVDMFVSSPTNKLDHQHLWISWAFDSTGIRDSSSKSLPNALVHSMSITFVHTLYKQQSWFQIDHLGRKD